MAERYTPPEVQAAAQAETRETSLENKENVAQLRGAVDKLIKKAEQHLIDSFSQEKGEGRFDFHDIEHTRGVRNRTKEIIRRMKDGGADVTERDLIIAELAAAAHDLLQEWNAEARMGALKKIREEQRVDLNTGMTLLTRSNELSSAAKMLEWMNELEQEEEMKIFTVEDHKKIMEALKATVAAFEFPTVVQPSLTPESSPVARAVALADLGESGTDPEAYLKGGLELFREEQLEMADLEPEKLTSEQKLDYIQRMLGWIKFQPMFARGRKSKLDSELAGLPPKAEENIKKYFSHFDETIAQAQARADKTVQLWEQAGIKLEELIKPEAGKDLTDEEIAENEQRKKRNEALLKERETELHEAFMAIASVMEYEFAKPAAEAEEKKEAA